MVLSLQVAETEKRETHEIHQGSLQMGILLFVCVHESMCLGGYTYVWMFECVWRWVQVCTQVCMCAVEVGVHAYENGMGWAEGTANGITWFYKSDEPQPD